MSAPRAPTIDVDDAENLRRFIEQMGRPSNAQTTVAQAEVEPGIQQHTAGDSTDTDRDRDLYEVSTNSSPATTAVIAHDMQSPMARGVVAPPPTPNVSIATDEVEQVAHDHNDVAQGITGLSLGDSKYAKGSPLAPMHYSRPSGVLVSQSPLSSKLSPEQRKDRDMSFARMSFITSDQPVVHFPKLMPKVHDLANSESKTFPEASLSYANPSIPFDFDPTTIDNSEEPKQKDSDIDIPTFKEVKIKTSDNDIPAITLANGAKDAEEVTSETAVPVTYRSTFMDKWIQSSKAKSDSEPASVSAQETSKKPKISEETLKVPVKVHSITPPPRLGAPKKPVATKETSKATVDGYAVLPPHLRATAKPFVPVVAEVNTKVKDGPTDNPKVITSQSTAPITPPFTPRALAPADKVETIQPAGPHYDTTRKARHDYSPSHGTLAAQAAKTEETLKHAVTFQAWPKAQGRDQAGT